MKQCQYKGCGKLFEPKYDPKQKFCSNECRLNARRLPKPPGWDEAAIRKLIEQRHQERCQKRALRKLQSSSVTIVTEDKGSTEHE